MIENYIREMSISHKEFHRLLPIALKNVDYEVTNHLIKFSYGSGNVEINTGIEQQRKIASLVLPVLHVAFTFSNVHSQKIEQFLNEFDRTYQRGGG
jgi:hypothetical protein